MQTGFSYLSEQVQLKAFWSSRGPNLLTKVWKFKGNFFFFRSLRKVVK